MSADAATTPAAAAPKEESFADSILTKYKTAGEIAASALAEVVMKAVEGATLLSLCQAGDAAVEAGTAGVYKSDKKMAKGSAFPTTISINNVICNWAPLPSDAESSKTLATGDVVKIQLGAQLDGYPAVAAETIVVGADASKPVTGKTADAIRAAWVGAEVALRSMKVGATNSEVSKKVEDAIKELGCRAVEGMQTNQFEKDVIDGKKKVVLAPEPSSRPDTIKLEENEVYGVDITVTTSKEGKPKVDDARTTIYKKTGSTYLLKMATSRKVFSDVQKKAGAFPFNLRIVEDEKRARMGVQECVSHNLLTPFEALADKEESAVVAQVFLTLATNSKGAIRLTPAPRWYNGSGDVVKPDAEVGEATKALLASAVRQTKVKAKKSKPAADAPAA